MNTQSQQEAERALQTRQGNKVIAREKDRVDEFLAQAGPPPQVTTALAVREDLGLLEPETVRQSVAHAADPVLEKQASDFVAKVLATSLSDTDARRVAEESVENLGGRVSQRAAKANELLKQPLKRLGELGLEGKQIAETLTDLKVQFDSVDPSRFNFEPGWGGRMLSWIPGVGKPINRYFTKFESAGNVIESLFDSLDVSRAQLERDIDTLRDDQAFMRQVTLQLQKVLQIGYLIDRKLQTTADGLVDGSEERKFVETELIFPLRQRLSDLQQQLLVNQQGVVMFEVLVRNNKELIRGVKRCRTVTYPALQIGVMASQALANQKIVIGKIEAINTVTGNFLQYNSQLLQKTGVEIHKRAASAQIDDAKLSQAIKGVIAALNDVDTFRQQAIGQMRGVIESRKEDIDEAEKAIQRLEKGNRARPQITLAIDSDEVSLVGRSGKSKIPID